MILFRLCEIDQNHLNIPFAAVRCAIHDLLPIDNQWNETANNLMIELLNKYVNNIGHYYLKKNYLYDL